MKNWLFVVPLLFASACTTFEDFQAMSPEERADKVCSATGASRQRRSALQDLNDQIATQEGLLSTGYRVYQNCQDVPVRIPVAAADCTGLSGDDLKTCQHKTTASRIEYRRLCQETAIPIDYTYESAMLRNLRMAREDQLDMHDMQNETCIAKARLLPAADAYSRYKMNAEP